MGDVPSSPPVTILGAGKERRTLYSWQHQLVSRIISNGDLNSVVQWGITHDDFTMSETKGFFTQLLGYYSAPETMGSVWGPQALMQKFPHFALCDDKSMTTDALCAEVRKDRIKVQTRQLVAQVGELVEVDPARAVGFLQEAAASLRNDCTPRKIDVHASDAMPRVWNNYLAAARGERVSVCPWPWEPLQKATLGIRSTDYIIVYGRPKSMKSWIICYLAAFIIDLDPAYRILIYSKEMDADEIFERIGCTMAGVDYEHFTAGRLTPEERDSFYCVADSLRLLKQRMTFVCLSAQDVRPGQDTVAWLESKIDRYKPHIVFVDGMYLMSDLHGSKKPNERVANISRALRQVVLHMKIPVIASVQANRDAAKNEDANTEEVAFSDSLGQDATMLIRVINEWKKGANTLALVMGGACRRYKLSGFRIHGMPAHNFSYYGELSDKEAQAVLKTEAQSKQASAVKPPRPLINKQESAEISKGAAEVAGMVH